jgi:hypothetical protein
MKLAIHGTKDGYRILYKTDDEFARIISRDIRKGAQGDEQLGKTAYSLAFIDNGCAYSKYVIVKDSLRSFATGTIAISLFVGVDETMKANDIFKLLNELYSSYDAEYIRNHYLNRGEKELIREDWSFVNGIISKYKSTPDSKRHENINSGTKDPAFIYYQDDNELLEYFDKPFQVEYRDYSQILFIQSNLQGSANPINVLKNSGIELEIDLENEPYYLNNYNWSKRIAITANGKPRSEGKNNNIIWTKDIVEISYTKNDQCYFPIHENGLLFDPKIKKYLEIKNKEIIINYEAFENPDPRIKKIVFEIKNHKGDPIDNAEIRIGEKTWEKISGHQYSHSFEGEDLKRRWTISGKKDNFKGEIMVIPIDETKNPELVLKERKKIKFQGEYKIENEVNNFSHIKISIRKKEIDESSNTEVEFIDDELSDQFEVIAIYSESNKYFYGKELFCPKDIEDGKSVTIDLKQRTSQQTSPIYLIDSGKGGTASVGYTNNKDGIGVLVEPKRGYKFIGFKLDETKKKGNYDGTLIAQYDENKFNFPIPKFMASAIVIGLGAGAFFYFYWKDKTNQSQQTQIKHIEAYIEGNSLLLDTLYRYKETLDKEQTEVLSSLDVAIKKREFINNWNFDTLKRLHYYSAQQKFKTAIEKIDSTRYNFVKKSLVNVSTLSLDQIADSIKAVLNPAKTATEKNPEIKIGESQKDATQSANPEPKKGEKNEEPQIKQPANSKQKKVDTLVSLPANATIRTDIKKELQSGLLSMEDLQKWKNDGMDNYKKSIDLYLQFWNLVLSGNNQFETFVKLCKDVKTEPVLQNSELMKFLHDISKDSKSFGNNYQNNITKVRKNPNLTLRKLKEQLK